MNNESSKEEWAKIQKARLKQNKNWNNLNSFSAAFKLSAMLAAKWVSFLLRLRLLEEAEQRRKKTDEIVTKDQQHLARSKSSFRTDLASFLHRGSAVLIVAARESFVEKVSLLNDDADGDLSIGSESRESFYLALADFLLPKRSIHFIMQLCLVSISSVPHLLLPCNFFLSFVPSERFPSPHTASMCEAQRRDSERPTSPIFAEPLHAVLCWASGR